MENTGIKGSADSGSLDLTKIGVVGLNETASKILAPDWASFMRKGVKLMLEQPAIRSTISEGHLARTPDRVVKAFQEYFWGVNVDPKSVLSTAFEEGTYDEMIVVDHIDFCSWCAHHLLPFMGQVHFAYIPDQRIVGLSKIPRLVEVLAARPQVQEQLTCQITDVFMDVVKPIGCAVMISATHTCMTVRGVKKPGSLTHTTTLRGAFKDDPATRNEFLMRIAANGGKK